MRVGKGELQQCLLPGLLIHVKVEPLARLCPNQLMNLELSAQAVSSELTVHVLYRQNQELGGGGTEGDGTAHSLPHSRPGQKQDL